MKNRSKHFVGNVAQKAVIEQDGKILIVRGLGDTLWELPGGRLHESETPQEGLAREIKEELNLEVEVAEPFYICRSYHNKNKCWQVLVVYRATLKNTLEPQIDKTELEEFRWVERNKILDLPLFEESAAAMRVHLRV